MEQSEENKDNMDNMEQSEDDKDNSMNMEDRLKIAFLLALCQIL